MPLLSDIAQRKKIDHFLSRIPKDAAVLEIGCGSGWAGAHMKSHGWTGYRGLDIVPPADIVGDIKGYPSLGLVPDSFDAIIAFEVIEHVECIRECHDLLKPGGELMLTSPVPHMDWLMKALELVGFNQKRTSPHSNLTYFSRINWFEIVDVRTVAGLAQWGIFRKPLAASATFA